MSTTETLTCEFCNHQWTPNACEGHICGGTRENADEVPQTPLGMLREVSRHGGNKAVADLLARYAVDLTNEGIERLQRALEECKNQ